MSVGDEECLILPGGFAGGDELLEIRKDVASLESKMRDAVGNGDLEMAVRFREAIVKTEARDPQARYNQLKAQYDEAVQAQDLDTMESSQDNMRLVKYFLPQYSLEGLWVGRSGPLRKQVIKITYQNDTLIGTKIYGDQVVPSGEVIFQVRVSPDSKRPDPIDVQHVTDPRLKKLERFTGEGRVVDKKRGSVKWVESQLILVGDYFAFAWIPLGIQVFFMRLPDRIVDKLENLEEERALLSRIVQMDNGSEGCDLGDDVHGTL